MKQLTIAFAILAVGVGFLLLLLSSDSNTEETEQAKVISHILTQSLDGNRYYLIVEHRDGTNSRIPTDKATLCPVGSKVTLSSQQSSVSNTKTYRLQHCLNR
ncbi:hypothetical protein ACGRH2_25165 [Vibrio barjaei]|uniref:NusG domain-containing protein n=1 Tax=Vibrio barjaei TaxID=1676683 RepID=A0ABW7IRH8_9VIBR